MLLTAVAVAVLSLPTTSGTVPRLLFGIPLLVFLPGYALVSAVYTKSDVPPTVTDGTQASASRWAGRSIDVYTRLGLSVASSVAIVAMVAYVLNFTAFGISPVPTLVTVSALTIVFSLVALWRRRAVTPTERFSVTLPSVHIRGATRGQTLLNVAIVVGVVFALSATGYALTAAEPTAGEPFTEFYLLTESETGEFVANDYPEALTAGEPTELAVGIENHEDGSRDYTVVVLLQRVDASGTLIEREQISQFQSSVAAGETDVVEHTVTPDGITGENLELVYLLYVDEPPAEPTRENAYRDLRLRVSVS
ncbi:DUF1616 domain-containing protein [Haloferax sp. MBLA0076]|uniref:DUF1616 domain-containing protein n=1 Tax=Haloferax litoreum TaxID=2666140 RepID=A0A6A8GKX2_9EURY|nr:MULTISPECIES: DUF1616 domain-containing protein [Haloferax]KAB1189936.1 DUF1616 domain-containing protein [Haloferax sp. CBA1148]MRX23706.1 DUF1616 domain-containing protein [Haloferax litoreum]